jgi:hypothetical protein
MGGTLVSKSVTPLMGVGDRPIVKTVTPHAPQPHTGCIFLLIGLTQSDDFWGAVRPKNHQIA